MWLGESLHSTCVWTVLVCVAPGVYRIQSCVVPAFGLVKSIYHLEKDANAALQVLVEVGMGCLVTLVLLTVALCFSKFPLC